MVENKSKVEVSYVMEAFRRLYECSVRYDMVVGNFDGIVVLSDRDSAGRIAIPYDEFYCPVPVYNKIVEDLLKESYVLMRGKARYKLKEHEKGVIRGNVALGCSPSGSTNLILRYSVPSDDFLKAFKSEDA